jgi:predicted phosphodiesterase
MSRLLIIGDTHLPYTRRHYLRFCKDLYKEYKCDSVLHIGDVVDSSAISFHIKNPEMPNAKLEYERTYEAVKNWHGAFPKAKVCIGNHDARIIRVAGSVNIPSQLLKSYRELWDTPGWDWQWEHTVDGVYYMHGEGNRGLHPAYNTMRKMALSVILGHSHSAAGIKWLVNPHARLFGMDVGCGIDDKALAFQYNQFNKIRSVISAAVVIDGMPYLELMPMGKGEKYWDKKGVKC